MPKTTKTPTPDSDAQAAPPPLPYRPLLEHFSPEERATRGKAARQDAPRSSHGRWEPISSRPDPVELLEEQSRERTQELIPIRYGRMLASPFAFFRGSAAIMASDLASTPRSGLNAQLCGDAHLSNFGIFAAPDRSLLFDINDFDETVPGPWEWDLKRLAASFEVAMRNRGVERDTRREVVLRGVRTYRQSMAEFAAMRTIDVWYERLDTNAIFEELRNLARAKDAAAVEQMVAKAEQKDSMRALAKLTEVIDGSPRIVSKPPLIVPASELLTGEALASFEKTIHEFLRNYAASLSDDIRQLMAQYRFVQIARKVVGVGSVGTRCWIVLTLGRDEQDPLFLQLKQAEVSVLERYVGRSRYRNHGRRVVEGQRLMQAASDVLLGWYKVLAFDGKVHDFYVRQLWDGKSSLDIETMPIGMFGPYADGCFWTLARAHARTGDRIAISAYLGPGDVFDTAIANFSNAYADQNEQDFEALQAAEKSGEIVAQRDV